MDRLALLREHIDVAGGRGLEIGPLVAPIVPRAMGEVYYVDRATTKELREWFASDPDIDVAKIVDVDFVWGEQTLAAATAGKAPFGYVVASHVLEHVPDMLGWLNEIIEVLRPGGRISLVIPDRRYTFDVRRRESDIAEVIEAYLLRLRRPAPRATFDHFFRHVDVDVAALWRGERGHADPPMDVRSRMGYVESALREDRYIDTHCWVFSDAGFADLLRLLLGSGLLDLRVVAFTPTRVNDFEFFVTLERPAGPNDIEARRAANAASVPDVRKLAGEQNRALLPADVAETAPSNATALDRIERIERANATLAETLATMRASGSWRLTAPLRRIHAALAARRGVSR